VTTEPSGVQQVLSSTTSVCPECLRVLPARRTVRGEDVYLEKTCPAHGSFETVLWRGQPGYAGWARPTIPTRPQVLMTAVEAGCPYDCGLCPDHRQQSCTVLLEVTQRCDLGCAYCFAATMNGLEADPSLATVERWYCRLLETRNPCNVQLSGGEPTVRDDLAEIVALGRGLGFPFIQVNTNGLRVAHESAYLRALQQAGLASLFLQFDGVDDAIYEKLRGERLLATKISAIENCAECGIGVVLVPTLVPGVNDHCIGSIIEFALRHVPTVRGVHFQTVSYLGRYPEEPTDRERITIPEVIRALHTQTRGLVKVSHFAPPGCENALCSFHGSFVLLSDGTLQALTRRSSCSCQPQRAEVGAAKARAFVARSWAPGKGTPVGGRRQLGEWDAFLERVQTHSFTISGMAFQDAWTLDIERLRDCCIHVLSPAGRVVPFCAYNLTSRSGRPLYRGRER